VTTGDPEYAATLAASYERDLRAERQRADAAEERMRVMQAALDQASVVEALYEHELTAARSELADVAARALMLPSPVRDSLQFEAARPRPSQLATDVRAFMALAGQAMPSAPMVPSREVTLLRVRLLTEEFVELLEAVGMQSETASTVRAFIERQVEADACGFMGKVDLVEVADALADLRFVAVGFDAACGIDGDAIDREVARSNFTKAPFTMRPDGKVTKSASYEPPRIAEVLRAQGWRP